MIDLSRYTTGGFERGASSLKEAAWWAVRALFFQTPVPWPSGLRVALLRLFGARIGEGVVIRSQVNITFPWRFTAGNHVWIGEEVMYSQPRPGDHRVELLHLPARIPLYRLPRFFLPSIFPAHQAITIREGSWIAASAFIAPGVQIGPGSMVAACSAVMTDVPPKVIVRGNPAGVVKQLD